jgi:hypothetical protein
VAGGGQVVEVARQYIGNPQRDADSARSGDL